MPNTISESTQETIEAPGPQDLQTKTITGIIVHRDLLLRYCQTNQLALWVHISGVKNSPTERALLGK